MGGGGGGTVSDSILGGGTKHLFLLILYNFRNIGGHVPPLPPPSPIPRSLYWTDSSFTIMKNSIELLRRAHIVFCF